MINMLRSLALSTRILLVVLALFVVGIWGLAARVASVLQPNLEQMQSQQLSTTVGYIAADMDREIQFRIDTMNQIAASITPAILADPARVQRLLERSNFSTALFSAGFVVANKNGTYIADYPRVAGRVGGFIGDRAYFREAMSGGALAISEPLMGRFLKKPVVTFAVPLRDAAGIAAGVLVHSISPSDPDLFGELEQTPIGKGGYLLVASPRDRLWVSSNDKSRILQPLPTRGLNPVFDRRMDEGFEGAAVTTSSFGQEVLGVSRGLKTTGWVVLAAVPTSEVFAPIASLKRQIYVTALLLALLLMAVLYIVLRRQLVPLKQAATAMRRMSEGTAALAPLPIAGEGEIGILIAEFNRLVTERKRLEERLRRSDISLDSLPIAIRYTDKAERIIYANRAYRTIVPVPIGRTVREVVGEGRYAAIAQNYRQALAGEATEATREVLGDDGATRTRLNRYLPDHDATGEVVGVFTLSEDITRQRHAEAALRQSEEHHRMVLDSLAEGVVVRDAQSRFLSANPAALRILGITAAAHSHSNLMDPAYRAVRENGSDWPADQHPSMQTLRSGEPRTNMVMGLHKPDGTLIWLSVNTRPLPGPDGAGIGGVITSFTDVTEQRNAQTAQRLAASMFANAAEAIMVTDRNNDIVTVNPAFSEITGYAQEEAIGKNPRLLSSGLQAAPYYEQMWDSIARTGRWSGEIWDRRNNGESYCEYLSISTVRDPDGEIVNYCAMFSDITARKNAEAALQRLNAELEQRVAERTQALEQANTEMQSFNYSISHDLRAPLRAINGFSKLVLAESAADLNEKMRENLGRIAAGAERMGRLIDDLLNLSQVSRQEMRRQAVNLSRIAGEIAHDLTQAHPQRRVEVLIAPDIMIDGDPNLIRILLENLIGNAWKFTARTAAAKIEVGRLDSGGETVCFVRDNGAGFDMRYVGKLFGAFQRLHTSREFEGTGIGLSIVQRIVVKHGGRIWAEAKPGQGATFYFTLA